MQPTHLVGDDVDIVSRGQELVAYPERILYCHFVLTTQNADTIGSVSSLLAYISE